MVEEVCHLELLSSGRFAVYELSKKQLTTLDTIDRLVRHWNLPRKNIAYAGMKDRHAVTTQWITIQNGSEDHLELPGFSLKYLGRTEKPINAGHIASNRFSIVLRSLDDNEVQLCERNLPKLEQQGVPNYFDDQRFGSLPKSNEFIAGAWIKQDYERALWLTFAEPLPDDSAPERKQKTILREHWGDWSTCKASLDRSHRRSIITFLDDKPGHFKGAWACVNQQLRGIYLSAFQSYLWNEILSNFIKFQTTAEQQSTVELKPGPVLFFQGLTDQQVNSFARTTIPLPSARLKLSAGFEADLIQGTLANLGWKLEELKVRHPRDRFFSKAQRKVLLKPEELRFQFSDDELYPGYKQLTLRFSLPRGSYATMVVKRLMQE